MYSELVTLFSSMQVFKQKALNYHWNVTGPDFYQLHLVLERVYGTVDGFTDRVAEHIRSYGRAPGLYSIYLKYSSVQENLAIPASLEVVSELVKDLSLLKADLDKANAAAAETNRYDTMNLLGDLAEQITVVSYLLESYRFGFNV